MNKTKHKLIWALTLLLCVFQYNHALSQDTISDKKMFLGAWVLYPPYSEDTLVYVPFQSPLANQISMELKFSPLTFEDNGECQQHLWKMCGNDDGPDFYQGKWELRTAGNQSILTLTGLHRKAKTYFVLELSKQRIVLVRKL